MKRFDNKVYGISQNPDTKDYILVHKNGYSNAYYYKEYCVKCGEKYLDIKHKWCKQCETNDLKNNFTNWTSGNERIDNFIQKMQLKIHDYKGILFEWIPYSQFENIIKMDTGGFSIVYSAIWKDGPIYYNQNKRKNLNKLVALKSLNNSQNISDEFLKEVCDHL